MSEADVITVSVFIYFLSPGCRGSHGQIFTLVHPVCIMLAAGAAGAGTLPPRLADSFAVQDYRNSGEWNSGIDRFNHKAPGPRTEENITGQVISEDSRSLMKSDIVGLTNLYSDIWTYEEATPPTSFAEVEGNIGKLSVIQGYYGIY